MALRFPFYLRLSAIKLISRRNDYNYDKHVQSAILPLAAGRLSNLICGSASAIFNKLISGSGACQPTSGFMSARQKTEVNDYLATNRVPCCQDNDDSVPTIF
jgi:hypothetical protein